MLKAILFDMDGSLVDTEVLHIRSFNEILKRWGARITHRDWFEKYLGVGSYFIMGDMFKRNGIKEDAKKWVKKRKKVFQEFTRRYRMRTIPGFRNFFKKVKKKGLKYAIVSGGHSSNVKASLRNVGIRERILLVTVEDVKRRKPFPDGFLLAAKKLGVKPSECLVFEDSVAGVTAAKRAGMKCVALLTSTTRKRLNHSTLVVKDYRDARLARFLEKQGLA